MLSSFINHDFVNYRKQTFESDRKKFSSSVRSKGQGNIPIVVDSVEEEIAQCLTTFTSHGSVSGIELVVHMDCTLHDVLKRVKIHLISNDCEHLMTTELALGLEEGTIPDLSSNLGDIYKHYRNKDDKILYILLTRQQSVYDYIKSILHYLTVKLKFWT